MKISANSISAAHDINDVLLHLSSIDPYLDGRPTILDSNVAIYSDRSIRDELVFPSRDNFDGKFSFEGEPGYSRVLD